ncbi:MAG: rRNA adenine N-6-methyltransferase family protein, partial [Pirellulaceae bacterium]
MNQRQTASFLKRKLHEIGVSPSSRHGQNFLIDLNLVELLARTAAIGPDDVVLEVGTGTGSLTCMFADQAAAVVTVE